MSERRSKLSEKIAAFKEHVTPFKQAYCALRQPCADCGGNGFSLVKSGALTSALLCQCVQDCPECFGACLRREVDGMRQCREPSPKRIVSLIRGACIPSRYIHASLDQFTNHGGNSQEILQNVRRWLKRFRPEGGQGLLLGGQVGVGKTFILTAVAKQLCLKGLGVRFIDFHQLLAQIRAGYADRRSEQDLISPLVGAQVLIIDELGKGKGSDWEMEMLDQIVAGRYNEDKVIVASTNYSLKKSGSAAKQQFFNTPLDADKAGFKEDDFTATLESRMGPRIYSRLVETSLMMTLEGPDFRKVLAARRNVGEVRS